LPNYGDKTTYLFERVFYTDNILDNCINICYNKKGKGIIVYKGESFMSIDKPSFREIAGVPYDATSSEITPEQHRRNVAILKAVENGLREVPKIDEPTKQIRQAFLEDSHRHGGRYSAAEKGGMAYDGFVDIDGYNRSLQ
jgi:hypothetical protein